MTTIIQQPKSDDSSVAGFVIGIVVAAIVAVLFVVYAWPTISKDNTVANPVPNVNVTIKEKNDVPEPDAAPPSSSTNP